MFFHYIMRIPLAFWGVLLYLHEFMGPGFFSDIYLASHIIKVELNVHKGLRRLIFLTCCLCFLPCVKISLIFLIIFLTKKVGFLVFFSFVETLMNLFKISFLCKGILHNGQVSRYKLKRWYLRYKKDGHIK